MTERETFLIWCLSMLLIWGISFILFMVCSQTYRNDILGHDKNPYNDKYNVVQKIFYMICMFLIAPLYVLWNLLTRGFKKKWS